MPAPATPAPAAGDLAALRSMLLAPEQAILQKIQQRLDDPALRATELADLLPSAMALASVNAEAFAATLRPLVREALLQVLKEQPHLAGGSARRSPFPNPLRTLLQKIRHPFRQRTAATVVDQLFLVKRSDGALVASAQRAQSAADESPRARHDQRNALALVTSLLSILRDPALAPRYAALRYLRVEHRLFGIHLSDDYLLLSIIRMPPASTDIPESRLAEFDNLVHHPGGVPILPQL
jgi:hypothetical protein